jgi:hypothetical protein
VDIAPHSDGLARLLRLILCRWHYDTDTHHLAISLDGTAMGNRWTALLRKAIGNLLVYRGREKPPARSTKARLRNAIEILRKQRAAIIPITAAPITLNHGVAARGAAARAASVFVIDVASCAYYAGTG